MKNNKLLIITRILYALFALGTVILFWMMYKDIDSSIAFKFGICYIGFTFFLLTFTAFIFISKLRKFEWIKIKKRMLKFVILFISFGGANFIFDYIVRPSEIDLFREFSIGFGFAFGIVFTDIIFFKINERHSDK